SGGEPGEILTYDWEQLYGRLPGMRLSAHQPCLHETLYAAENAGITFEEVILVGVVGHSFEVGTQLGPYVSDAMPQALDLVLQILSRHGIQSRRREHPLSQATWWAKEVAAVGTT